MDIAKKLPISRFCEADCPTIPWKNGGGTMRELTFGSHAGKTVWWLSVADIPQSGAFSGFPGLERIHTIIAGNGLTLGNAVVQMQARPLVPLYFDGALDLNAQLKDGPCRALNVIFDPTLITAQADLLSEGPIETIAGETVLFVVKGHLECAGVGGCGHGEGVVLPPSANVKILAESQVLRVVINPKTTPITQTPPDDRN